MPKTKRRNGEGVDVEMAALILDVLGSDCDPISHAGIETTARDLGYGELAHKSIHDVRIQFYGTRNGKHKRINGTLYSMILDRLKHL